MSASPAILPAAQEPPPAPRFLDTLAGLYVSPLEAFTRMLVRASWLPPLLVSVALQLTFTGIWMHKVDPAQFFRNQLEESGDADRISPERTQAALEQQVRLFPVMGWLGGLLAPPLVALALAGLFHFIYRFFYAAESSFRQALAVLAWSFLAVALVSTPLTLGVMALKDEWDINPQSALQANLSLLLERESTNGAVYALAGSMDLFSFWLLFLLASGFGAAARTPTARAAWGVAGPWLVWVLGRAGLAALTG